MAEAPAPALAELQRQMLATIRGGAGADEGLSAHIVSDSRLGSADRLGIYADMYFWRLLEVLRGAFPRLVILLGDDAFAALAARYLAAHPSRHPSLRLLGDRLAAFLRDDPAQPTWVGDLAALEWARYDVFDEADAALVTLEALRARSPQSFAELPVALVPAHRWLELQHAVEISWRALKPDGTPIDQPPSLPRTLLVWRQDSMVYHRVLAGDELTLLALARAGTSFGIICETLAAALEAAANHAPAAAAQTAFALLARWVGDGLLAATAPPPSESPPCVQL